MTRNSLLTLLAALVGAQAGEPHTYTNSVGIEFVRIEPGSMQVAVFQPSCPAEEDAQKQMAPELRWTHADYSLCRQLVSRDASPGFRVDISRPFYVGKFEITQAEFFRVMRRNPAMFQGDKVAGDASRHPVEEVSWKDAQAFVRKLNELEKTRAYRLPTEFEWEYAGRAGGSGQVDWNIIRRQAVQGLRARLGAEKPTTSRVGSKEPNAWGLYDMLAGEPEGDDGLH